MGISWTPYGLVLVFSNKNHVEAINTKHIQKWPIHRRSCVYVCVCAGRGGYFFIGYHYLDCVYVNVNANACMAYTCEFLLYGLGHCKENCCLLYLHFTKVSLLHTTCIATL